MGQVIRLNFTPQYKYIIEATKTVDGEMMLYHFDVQAPSIAIAWRKADLIAEAHFMESWLCWRVDKPEPTLRA